MQCSSWQATGQDGSYKPYEGRRIAHGTGSSALREVDAEKVRAGLRIGDIDVVEIGVLKCYCALPQRLSSESRRQVCVQTEDST